MIIDIIVNILSTPAILVGLMAMVGLILQGKPKEIVIKGTIKTIAGFVVLGAGAGYLLSGSLNDFGTLFNFAFNIQGVVPNNEAIVATALVEFGGATALIMCFGMIANLLLARFSRLKYIFLTGHHTLYMACLIAVLLTAGGLEGTMLIVAGSALLGLIMVLSPAITQSTMQKITGTPDLAFGHFGGAGYWLSAQIGKLFKGSKSSEEINFPKGLSFLRDTTVSIAITMILFFLIVTGAAMANGAMSDPVISTWFTSGDTHTHWTIWAIMHGINFAAGVYIILAGVRLVIGEIVPAFKGISEKLVPNAKPALDCPVVFPFAPNAVVIGFLCSFAGGLVGLAILGAINVALIPVALILPGVIPHFFCGATAGVFGNAEGGLKGCVAGSFVHGLAITFLPALTMPVMGALKFANTTFSDADFSIVGIVIGNTAQYVQGLGLFMVCIVLFLLPIIYNLVAPKKA
jgi:PTS system ascorbate-specific IIC component